jgi:hypothetical protein
LTIVEKTTQEQALSVYKSVRETIQLNEKDIYSAAPVNYTLFVNLTDILTPLVDETPFTPSTTHSPPPATSTSFIPPEFEKYGKVYFSKLIP